MLKKFLFFILLFQQVCLSNIVLSEILPIKKPLQTKKETRKKLLVDMLKPLPKPTKKIKEKDIVKKEKKIPVRLHAKLLEVKQPIVGLKFITEIRAISDIEAEPFYECKLCNNQGEAHGMVNHVVGRNHREKFLTQKYHKASLAKSKH